MTALPRDALKTTAWLIVGVSAYEPTRMRTMSPTAAAPSPSATNSYGSVLVPVPPLPLTSTKCVTPVATAFRTPLEASVILSNWSDVSRLRVVRLHIRLKKVKSTRFRSATVDAA